MRFAVLALVVCGCCAAPPPAPDVGPAPLHVSDSGPTGCHTACVNLAALGCPEGGASCDLTCVHVVASGLTDLRVDCLTAAKTKEAARACGSVSCP